MERLLRVVPLYAAAVALVASGCSARADKSNATETISGEPTPFAELADVCEPRMAQALQAWEDEGVTASITVQGGERECSVGLGTADRETGSAVTAQTAFSIGSITKAVTAAGILKLADEGLVNIDDPVGDHVTGLTGDVNDATLRHLLLHTSGLTGYHGEDHIAMSAEEATDAISKLSMLNEPGTTYSYTNSGYTLLALVIESVTDQGYRQYLQDEILFDGDGRRVGGFWDGEPAVSDPRSFGYFSDGQQGESGDFDGPHWAMDGNGGIAMTTLDMAAWTRALFSGQILSEEATTQLTSIKKNLGDGKTELPGWGQPDPKQFGETAILASGGGGQIGHHMDVAWLPDTDRVMVIATSAHTPNTREFGYFLSQALLTGTGVPTPPTIPEPDASLMADLVGTYQVGDDPQDRIEIAVDDNDDRGLRVTATGPNTIPLFAGPSDGFEGEIELHETNVARFLAGETSEGQRHLEGLEAERGLLVDTEILATVVADVPVTYVLLTFDADTDVALIELNRQGGSEGLGFGYPSEWFVSDEEGNFTPYRAIKAEAKPLQIRPGPTDQTLEIENPTGVTTAQRVD